MRDSGCFHFLNLHFYSILNVEILLNKMLKNINTCELIANAMFTYSFSGNMFIIYCLCVWIYVPVCMRVFLCFKLLHTNYSHSSSPNFLLYSSILSLCTVNRISMHYYRQVCTKIPVTFRLHIKHNLSKNPLHDYIGRCQHDFFSHHIFSVYQACHDTIQTTQMHTQHEIPHHP